MLVKLARQCSRLGTKCFSPVASVPQTRNYSSNQQPESMVGRNFLTLKHFSPEEIETFLWTAGDLKKRYKEFDQKYRPFENKSIGLIFQKRSTRTRLSSETGFSLMGGQACFLTPDDIHLGVNESIKDSARVLTGFLDLILARVYGQEILDELALESSIPVISGLSDMYHPLQCLADLLTLQEHFGWLRLLKVAYVGDGNNIIHSLLMGCVKMGVDVSVATPQGYECDKNVIKDAIGYAQISGSQIKFTNDPEEAVSRADVIVTDTWVSMGQEEEKEKRLKDFAGYQVNRKMCSRANDNWRFLHCLPRKPYEVTDDVFYDKERSLVWQEAENRKWTVMAVMHHLLKDYVPTTPKPNFRRLY